MKLGFRKGEKGFTLVELMVVMAIMAILASVVVPAVSGTKQTSQNTQVQQDGSAVETAVGKYNADANIAEKFTTDNVNVTDDPATPTTSSRWPEDYITNIYFNEFPENTTGAVASVTINDYYGTTIYQTDGSENQTMGDFAGDYTAIYMNPLVSGGYLTQEPRSYTVFSAQSYRTFLWLLEKVATEDGIQTGRVVAVFRLSEISGSAGDYLTYERVY